MNNQTDNPGPGGSQAKPFARVLLSLRTEPETVKAVVAEIKANRRRTSEAIAKNHRISRTQTGFIRSLVNHAPDLLERVLSDEISIHEATRLLAQGNGQPREAPRKVQPSAMAELRKDFDAWVSLTRELLDSVERVLAQSQE